MTKAKCVMCGKKATDKVEFTFSNFENNENIFSITRVVCGKLHDTKVRQIEYSSYHGGECIIDALTTPLVRSQK